MRRPSVNLKPWEVLAYLAGSKTMIARPIIPQPTSVDYIAHKGIPYNGDAELLMKHLRCPLGSPGDVLAGKEAWSVSSAQDDVPSSELPSDLGRQYLVTERHFYLLGKKRRAQHMPPWAVRIHLEIEEVWAKRAGEITEAEAQALCESHIDEGATYYGPAGRGDACALRAFADQWDIDYPRFPWASDPWVWLARAPMVTP